MKRVTFMALVLVSLSLIFGGVASARMETATGKITAIDPDGKAIVIVKGTGYGALTRGTIVGPDTVVKVRGKKASLNSLKVGDRVTIKLERSDNLYAKQIIKK